MSSHPLPWSKVRHALGHSITDAGGGVVAEAMTEAEVDAILVVTNKVPALVEAAQAAIDEDSGMMCVPQLHTALAAFKT
jgi:hypothetical protein